MAEGTHQIWLLRHGETEWSKSGQHTGRTDIPLTEPGRHQAEALGRHLGRRPFALVLTSPLQRARETCRLAGYGDVAAVTDDLLEWDYGIYEGRRTADIQVEQPRWSIWTTSMPNGETVIEADNCVFHRMAVKDREICHLDKGLMETFTDSKVDHDECMAHGGDLCRFRFSSKKE